MKFLLFLTILFLNFQSLSHFGKLASDGCHYCRKNCKKLGYEKNKRHSHDGRSCNQNSKRIKNNSITHKIYSRKAFKHWIDVDNDCQNTRHEILIKRSLIPVSFKNKKKCSVDKGKWNDFYFDEVLLSSSKIDIDHIVPLKEAWITGANKWSSTKREEFANDLENLVITNKKHNRKKGAQTPLTWSPINRIYYCKYLKQWIKIKKKYKLKINKKIYSNYKLAKCNSLILSLII